MFVCVWLEKSVQNNDFVSIRGYRERERREERRSLNDVFGVVRACLFVCG